MHKFNVRTSARNELIDITQKVTAQVNKSGVESGICTVYCPHTTGAITINESADPSVASDITKKLRSMIPKNENYSHAEGNSDAHIKSSLVGNTVQVIIENGALQLGTWQGIFFCEFDGPRSRNVWVKIQ
ncbi:MAG: secondary thiamine-phosphate synthase enzyme YjbQ [Candidatus Marinimicrobia bacterium]|nr:secondary thiamine-phosphate synthase enzyme YjbQ [Candidatus Neomarinimicrobiota bacterium]